MDIKVEAHVRGLIFSVCSLSFVLVLFGVLRLFQIEEVLTLNRQILSAKSSQRKQIYYFGRKTINLSAALPVLRAY